MKEIFFTSDDFKLIIHGFNIESLKNSGEVTENLDVQEIIDHEEDSGYMISIVNSNFDTILSIAVAVEDGQHEREGGKFGNIDFGRQELRNFEYELVEAMLLNSFKFSENSELNIQVKRMVLFMFHDMNIYDL